MPLHRLRHVLVVLLAFLCGALIALLVLPRPAVRNGGSGGAMTFGKALVGGPFTLTDQTGRRVSEKDFRGRYMLIYFGFTLCPDICPAGLQTMMAALDGLGPMANQIVPIFITVDPEHDTPAVVADYVKNFSPHLVGLTGTTDEVRAVAKAYHVYFQKQAEPKSTAGYTIDHTAIFYVMDPNGDYVTHLQHSVGVDDMIRQLKQMF